MKKGWISLYRKTLDNPVVCKDSDYLATWVYLLLNATHKDIDIMWSGKRITLHAGQFVTSRKSIAEKFNISESKVQRILKMFENEQQIEQLTNRHSRIITICGWNEFQQSEQQNEQLLNDYRTTSERLVNTNNNKDNTNNIITRGGARFKPPSLDEVKQYCSDRNNTVEPERFIDFYKSKNWYVGKNKMTDWKAAVRTWEKRSNKQPANQPTNMNDLDDIF